MTDLAFDLAGGPESPAPELPQMLRQTLAAWWRTNENWDGAIWKDKIAGYEADGTGHAPTTASLNGHTVLRFNGSSQYLTFGADVAGLFNGTDYTIAIAYRLRNGDGNESLFGLSDGLAASEQMWIYSSSVGGRDKLTFMHREATAADYNSANGFAGGYNCVVAAYDDTSGNQYFTSNYESEETVAQTKGLTGLDQGAIGMQWQTTFGAPGEVDIAEICIFSGRLSTEDASALRDYFNERYDVWQKIEAMPGLVAAWDPRRGITTDTGVSDWADVVSDQTVSQATGSQQPTQAIVGPGTSGAPALLFDDAASQSLESADLPDVSAAVVSDNWTFVAAARSDDMYGEQSLISAASDGTLSAVNMYFSAAGTLANQVLNGTSSTPTVASAVSLDTDFWAVATSEVGVVSAAGTDTETAQDIEKAEQIAIGCRWPYWTARSRYLSGHMYAALVFSRQLDSVEISILASLLEDLMGI